MAENRNGKQYDLEERTYQFARDVRAFIKKLPRTLANIEDARQVINSSGSVGSNYIEANEALSKKDFVMRIKICRKEAKESRLWLRLLYTADRKDVDSIRGSLVQEAVELTSIFGAIVRKSEG
jgi:four helix bundle protein